MAFGHLEILVRGAIKLPMAACTAYGKKLDLTMPHIAALEGLRTASRI